MILHEMTLPAFVTELASNSPAPGGGSIAALGGALAAGLVSMVGELTRGREKYAAVQADMDALCAKGKKYAETLLKLIDEDTAAFNDFMAAMKLPKDTDEQKAARKAAMQEAAKGTVEVPLRTLNLCAEVANLALVAVREGNVNAVSDAGTAGQFARAAGTCAAYNVRINLLGIKDEAYAAEKRAAMNAALSAIDAAMAELTELMEKRLG
ncbi:cyclodeaminase/cyclohydrolase family protein [Pyramidobacter sp. C12-8]|uniref:cyclodeaminase/cyclohydrolase family protein n=1 Tax=Pyramidobacter sp. C12-8 TaxID=1943580 RepID=UPI00098EC10B|nr:cyclodeaminase/cyclohydrolase family protein [Pyramidobacter sp. C12-8]OON87070.1 methenyltetrahydrofolate cyclohydrolase [Pyramidobacter sp. C12-8]